MKPAIPVILSVTLCVHLCSCSWIFMDTVPDDYRPDQPIDCSGTTLPVIDSVFAAAYLLSVVLSVVAVASGSDECDPEDSGFICFSPRDSGVIGLLVNTPFLLLHGFSAWSGWCWVDECEQVKREHLKWYYSRSPEEQATFNKTIEDQHCRELKSSLMSSQYRAGWRQYMKECREYAREDANDKDGHARNLLHLAVRRGIYRDVRLAVMFGADIDAQDKYGWTPLHYAVSTGNQRLVKYLLKHGASPEIKDNQGKTPLVIAQEKGHEDIANLLKSQTPSQ